MSSDKRHVPRINLKQIISFGNDRTIELVEVSDISTEGIAFFSKHQLEKGVSIFLIFPGNEQIMENELAVTIMNCAPSGNPAHPYKISAAFLDANIKYLEDIKKLYEESL